MNSRDFIKSKLKPRYFWDVNPEIMKEDSAFRLIIERVFTRGDIHEMNETLRFYGKKKVTDVLSNLNYLDPKTLNFIAKFFNKPIIEFRCYQRKQSGPQFWNS